MKVLVAGATGYVGKQLVAQLVQAGHEVTLYGAGRLACQLSWCASSRGRRFRSRNVAHALRNIEVAYYLIHSMSGGGRWV